MQSVTTPSMPVFGFSKLRILIIVWVFVKAFPCYFDRSSCRFHLLIFPDFPFLGNSHRFLILLKGSSGHCGNSVVRCSMSLNLRKSFALLLKLLTITVLTITLHNITLLPHYTTYHSSTYSLHLLITLITNTLLTSAYYRSYLFISSFSINSFFFAALF